MRTISVSEASIGARIFKIANDILVKVELHISITVYSRILYTYEYKITD